MSLALAKAHRGSAGGREQTDMATARALFREGLRQRDLQRADEIVRETCRLYSYDPDVLKAWSARDVMAGAIRTIAIGRIVKEVGLGLEAAARAAGCKNAQSTRGHVTGLLNRKNRR